MEKQDELEIDIKDVDRILKEEVGLGSTNKNQIRLFLNGNEKSHLYLKCALDHPTLWGKYPTLTIDKIKDIEEEPIDVKYKYFENVKHAKTFTLKDLESLTDWNIYPEQTLKTKIYLKETIEERRVPFHSQPEYETYRRLKELGVVKCFRTQSFSIPYATYHKKIRLYFPDFIFLTPEGYIAIVESKPTTLMSTFMVRCKYEALKDYCEKHGFIYAMMDEQLQTFSSIQRMKEDNAITDYVKDLINLAGLVNDFALTLVYNAFKAHTQQAIKDVISRFAIQHDYYNPSKYGFRLTHQRFSPHRLQKHVIKKEDHHDQ